MIENLDSENVAVATRWFVPSGHVYQQSVHSALQWLSHHMWHSYYARVLARLSESRTEEADAWKEDPQDHRFNFGREGSARRFIPRIYPDSYYDLH